MEYSDFIHQIKPVACIVSIEHLSDKNYGEIKIVDANERYRATVLEDTSKFVKNVPYTNYIRRDHNFEGMCYQCADTGKSLHAYVDASFFNSWMEIYMIPLISPIEGQAWVLFSYDMTPKADAEKLGDVLPETASFVLKACIKLRESDDFLNAVNSITEDIRVAFGSKHCTILLTDFANKTCSVFSDAYIQDGTEPPMENFMDEHFFDLVETWPRLIDGSNCFIINNDYEWEHARSVSPEWAENLKVSNVHNIVIYPLISNGETIAYIWAVDFDREKTSQIKEIMELTTFILTAEISNHLMVKKMKVMSSTDLLTGVLNRNAMNNRISDNDSGAEVISMPFGVFFVDVNGLKTVNDTKGHIAGDELLKEVSHILCDIFPDQEIYRVGGDEFLVMTIGVSKEQFDAFEEELKSKAERPGHANYAYGSCFCGDSKDIRKAMQIADGKMYENKEDYYKRHPEFEWDRRMSRKGQ